MKVVFVGGGTGGHFYPLISIAEKIAQYAVDNQLVEPKMYYLGPKPYDEKALYRANLKFVQCPAGKMHRMQDVISRIKNFFALFPISLGVLKAMLILYSILPDVVFSKGGYASFPVLVAARLLRIPVVMHESDASLGRVNRWTLNFAEYIAIAYPEVEKELTDKQKERVALIGNPTRQDIVYNPTSDAYEFLKLKEGVPTILVIGGSSGSIYVNDNIVDALPRLLKKYQVIHQTGTKHIDAVRQEVKAFLSEEKGLQKYLPVAFLNSYQLRAAYTTASLVVSRAGSGTLFEIAEWGIPSIIIPIRTEVSHDQLKNAYAYARSTGAIVIEEGNLLPNLLVAQIEKILDNPKVYKHLQTKAKAFATPDAADKIAQLLIRILKSHET